MPRQLRLLFPAVAWFLVGNSLQAQLASTGPAELAAVVQVDEADSAARGLLQRAKAHLAERQWDEAIDLLTEAMQKHGEQVVRVDRGRYLPVREYCQIQLGQLPPEGRALYRGRVDTQAKRWYEQGLADRNPKLLQRIVDELLISSYGDKALWALGEIELEQGHPQRARWCWQRISETLREEAGGEAQGGESPATAPAKTDKNSKEAALPADKPAEFPPPHWLYYPDSQLPMPEARARLALASILEGAYDRATREIDRLDRMYPGAVGRMAGREGPLAESLRRLLKQAQDRPAPAPPTDWPTFAGAATRSAIAAPRSRFGALLWSAPLVDRPFAADPAVARNPEFKLPPFRVGEDQRGLLSFHPLIVDDLVLYCTVDKVFALKLSTGKPAWPVPSGGEGASREPGEIYRAGSRDLGPDTLGAAVYYHAYGAPRFTMTACGHRLYARLGSPVTAHPVDEPFVGGTSSLVCLDLKAQGYLRWRVPEPGKEDERWSFEGAPVCDGASVYVAMRRSDIRPQEHVACFDAQTGALRWRRLVCSAESPARGQAEEITHNLLTLAEGTLYLNTNLGVIAALSTDDGHIQWLYQYERSRRAADAGGRQFYRDLNPCVYDRGRVFAAPSDTPAIFALDASTGEPLWENRKASDAAQLLGVAGGNLIATGRRLYWLNVEHGDRQFQFVPDQPTVTGYGRGALIGDLVYWPTRSDIRIFRQDYGATRQQEPPDPAQFGGGNIVAAGEYLLIATADKLYAFGPSATSPAPKPSPLADTQIEADWAQAHRLRHSRSEVPIPPLE